MAVLKQYGADAMGGRPLLDGPLEMTVVAVWPWPKSLSAKKRALPWAQYKATTPDADNITKIIKDALNLVVFTDDARITDLHVHKRFGDLPGVSVEVRTFGSDAARIDAPSNVDGDARARWNTPTPAAASDT